MGYKVTYAGNQLDDYCTVLNIGRTVIPPRTNYTKEIPSIHGEIYTGYKYGSRVFSLECAFVAEDREDYADKARQLAFILDTKEPSRLIFEDAPHLYYYAVVDGGIEIEKVGFTGKFTINFVCHDPIGYAIEEEVFDLEPGNVVQIDNGGTIDAYPVSCVQFSKDAYFLQCSNSDGETIMLGNLPGVSKTKVPANSRVLTDKCESLNGWLSTGNVIDAGREVTSDLAMNAGGWALTYGSFQSGNADKWYGSAMRKNLSQNVKDFKIQVKLEHNSKGDLNNVGAGVVRPSEIKGDYYTVNCSPCAIVRTEANSSSKKIGSIKNKTKIQVANISKNWGEVACNGLVGYINMDHVKKVEEKKNNSSSGGSSGGSSSSSAKYSITAKSGLILRKDRGTKYAKLTVIPYKKVVTISDIKSGWGKVTYGGKTGYVAMQYTKKEKTSPKSIEMLSGDSSITNDSGSAESKLGIIEIYGFDQQGNKLFKMEMCDDQSFYEYSEPSIQFGSTVVLDDKKNCPAPKQVQKRNDKDKIVMERVNSGKFGDWNEMKGWFTIQRKTLKDGKQEWQASIEKIGKDNKPVKTIKTQKLIDSNYPTGALNNIVVFMGGYKNEPVVDVMNVREIYVTTLTDIDSSSKIQPIARKGEEIIIDHKEQKIFKKNKLFMKSLDIGSQFFGVPVGNSEISFKSDDPKIDVTTAIHERWL